LKHDAKARPIRALNSNRNDKIKIKATPLMHRKLTLSKKCVSKCYFVFVLISNIRNIPHTNELLKKNTNSMDSIQTKKSTQMNPHFNQSANAKLRVAQVFAK
jgi:hypothetical protein